ncbi:hypothetical protein ACO0RG_000501 [Hanseniaspora osmophila]|uniref:amidase n=1 Tax=Hanseniaspora osmophila TaxID=56408 RepID=A0A1E5R189_9ASCO|nr:putative amidase [Hanseniaspora osmophila]
MTFENENALYATEDPKSFEKWVPLIKKYTDDLTKQCKEYDSEFYSKVLATVAPETSLDSQAINALEYLPKLLSKEELAIVSEYDIATLLEKQKTKKLSALDITNAYIKAAIVSHISTNCIMQFLIPEALETAKKLDLYLKENNNELYGPFHGIPISLKEQINYKGKITTASYVQYLTNIPEQSGVTVQILEKMGAVFHCRTSQPQAIMHLDTWNNIIGRTRNPLSTKLSSGGSSGGESSCIASHASVLGIGSDIGGSIRAPAAFTNLYGLKPTTRRISLMNGLSGGKGQESIVACQGPLARSIEELDYLMESYINNGQPWNYDPLCVPVPWKDTSVDSLTKGGKKPLRIGVLFEDELVTPFPAITRGINHTIETLTKAFPGEFEFVDLKKHWYTEEEMKKIYNNNVTLYTVDGNKVQMSMFKESGEPILPLTRHFFEFGGGLEHSIYENKMLNYQRDTLKVEMHEKFFNGLNLDFILSPTYPAPAEKAANSLYWGYTSFWNMLDYPNVVFPTGISHDPELDVINEEMKFKSNNYEKMVWFDKSGKIRYDPMDYVGGPVALQLTAKRFEDERIVACIKKWNQALKVERR